MNSHMCITLKYLFKIKSLYTNCFNNYGRVHRLKSILNEPVLDLKKILELGSNLYLK